MNIRVLTLGRAAAIVGDRIIDPGAEILFAGLLMLALERGRAIVRDEMSAMLWPDADRAQQKSRLRWLLNKLRMAGVSVERAGTGISLPPDAVDLDFLGVESVDPDAIGAVLPGFSPDFSAPFTGWLNAARDHIVTATVRGLLPRLHAATRSDSWGLASRIAAAIQRVDPANEEAVMALAEARYRLGAKAQALGGLEAYLDAAGEERAQLHLRVRVLRSRLRSAATNVFSSETMFVGREEQLRRLIALLGATRSGSGGALLLVGPAGIGKTRLLDEALARAATGMQVIRLRCQRDDVNRPLSALVDLAPLALTLRGAIGADPSSFERLSRFASTGPDTADSREAPSPEVLRAQLGRALLDTLDAAAAEIPVVIVVDDIHWADPSLAWLWDRIIPWTDTRRVALLFAGRGAGANQPSFDVPAIAVPSLESQAARQLIDDVLESAGRAPTDEIRTALLGRGGGSPLFLRELARQWTTTGSIDPSPTSLMGLFDAGLAALSPIALRAVAGAAILGAYATLDRMERVMQIPRGRFIDAVIELEHAGILAADANGQVYGHVLWADVALKQISETVARVLHRYAAECLEEEHHETPTVALLWETARHWIGAERPERAREAVIQGAEHLRNHGFPGEAAHVYRDAADRALDASDRLNLLRRRIDLLFEAGSLDQVELAIPEHERLAVELNPGYDLHNDLEMLQSYIAHFGRGELDSVIEKTLACARETRAASEHRLRAAMECARFASFDHKDVLEELRVLVRGIRPATAEDRWNRRIVDFEYHANFGDPRRAATIAAAQLREFGDSESARKRVLASAMRGMSQYLIGHFGDAREAYGTAVALAAKHGLVHARGTAYGMWLGVSFGMDPPAVTRALLEEAKQPLIQFEHQGAGAAAARLVNYEAELSIHEGSPAEALRLVVPLDAALGERVRLWRARFLAIHLSARMALGDWSRLDEIAGSLRSCFTGPRSWLDWPAAVLAEWMVENGLGADAAEFAAYHLREVRRELFPPPAILQQLAASAMHR